MIVRVNYIKWKCRVKEYDNFHYRMLFHKTFFRIEQFRLNALTKIYRRNSYLNDPPKWIIVLALYGSGLFIGIRHVLIFGAFPLPSLHLHASCDDNVIIQTINYAFLFVYCPFARWWWWCRCVCAGRKTRHVSENIVRIVASREMRLKHKGRMALALDFINCAIFFNTKIKWWKEMYEKKHIAYNDVMLYAIKLKRLMFMMMIKCVRRKRK